MSTSQEFVRGFHGVRYQTKDVSRAIAFYVDDLGFKLEHQQLPAFAAISRGPLHILLCGPEACPGGKQIQLLDRDGTPIELFAPAQ